MLYEAYLQLPGGIHETKPAFFGSNLDQLLFNIREYWERLFHGMAPEVKCCMSEAMPDGRTSLQVQVVCSDYFADYELIKYYAVGSKHVRQGFNVQLNPMPGRTQDSTHYALGTTINGHSWVELQPMSPDELEVIQRAISDLLTKIKTDENTQ